MSLVKYGVGGKIHSQITQKTEGGKKVTSTKDLPKKPKGK